mmetsp:Transcript_54146/g.115584  ORF Transcript_54146/g.115584 Transcript_54146/m.115584 type:complete len:218 (-) Transcript_54146:135-788(-)
MVATLGSTRRRRRASVGRAARCIESTHSSRAAGSRWQVSGLLDARCISSTSAWPSDRPTWHRAAPSTFEWDPSASAAASASASGPAGTAAATPPTATTPTTTTTATRISKPTTASPGTSVTPVTIATTAATTTTTATPAAFGAAAHTPTTTGARLPHAPASTATTANATANATTTTTTTTATATASTSATSARRRCACFGAPAASTLHHSGVTSGQR